MKFLSTIIMILALQSTLFAQGGGKTMAKHTDKTDVYKIGDKVNHFKLKNVDGSMKSLSSIPDAKGYIVIFTSNVCPYAVGYEDRIVELDRKMAPKGYHVVTINSNSEKIDAGDSFDAMVMNAKERDLKFLYLKDDKGLYKKFGANKTPHAFVVDKNMTLQYIGAIDDNAKDANGVEERFVENAIKALEKGEKPSPNTTKAIGCPIKAGDSADKGKRPGGHPSPEQLMGRLDANKDGKISKDEARGPMSEDFDKLDVDKDGALTSEELSNMKMPPKGGRGH